MCNFPFDSLFNVAYKATFKKCLNVYMLSRADPEVLAEVSVLKELCNVRDNLIECEIDICTDLFLSFFTV